jgi:O-antigen ligase
MISNDQNSRGKLGQQIALAGLAIYVATAPHSVAASVIGVAIAGVGWVIRTISTGNLGLRRSKFDVLIVLSLLWTAISALLSEEPRISIAKLQASWCVFLFYLARATITRSSALALTVLLIVSGSAGSLYSAFDLLRGRGVVVESIAANSPLQQVGIQPGDTVWQINRHRVYSAADVDRLLAEAPPNSTVSVGIISQGEQVERSFVLNQQPSSGILGGDRNHHFRASGWTRHYQTFAELISMIALLALGIALANLRNHGPNKYFRVAIVAAALLTAGILFTAMRTVIVAFVIGAIVIAFRSLRGTMKIAFTFALFFVLAFGAVVVWQTRDRSALLLGDSSSSLRMQVARVGLSRILIHPIFGHGMDAMQKHWNEWGFPGKDMLHLHSTPLQLAFDRGLPMLVLWLWLMIAFWVFTARAERTASDLSDTHSYGILLGILGALTGFLASSVVNYNYGDAEVAMMFWFLMGTALSTDYTDSSSVESVD